MGRGRQKAKHTKVARELKYYSPDTDYSALEQELGKGESSGPLRPLEDHESTDEDDRSDWPRRPSRY